MKIDELYIIEENSKSERTYKCPYCNERMTRVDLVYHINDKHEEMIPQDYSSARLVFNYINKKECGKCTECGKETEWMEEVWRYDRFCKNPKCRESYVKKMKSRMVGVYGKEHLLNEPDKQNEMLSNRSISGTYKFIDGGVRSYVGSYEKKLLEWYDLVLKVPSKDIVTPGPTIEYEYKGKKHFWITDIYYIPANLVHDVKDGGNNPNTRDMKEYRGKQVAKEKAIEDLKKYNYLRLTDNNFEQLLLALTEIKQRLMDNEEGFITNINELCSTVGVMANVNDYNAGYIIPCMVNNTFIDTAYSTDKFLQDIYMVRNNKLKKIDMKELNKYDQISLFKYLGEDYKEKMNIIINDYNKNKEIEHENYFYNILTNRELISKDQILFDENFEECLNGYEESAINIEIEEQTLIHKYKLLTEGRYFIDLSSINDILLAKSIGIEDRIKQDANGYFLYNENNNKRTKSYNSIQEIPNIVF